ncbi:MAG: ribosomal protein S19 family protein [Candidatus Micrarchaeota archaeon]|nr:ribosomal protein S19 family protein [Candidatus Micrarchaeota archaeon]
MPRVFAFRGKSLEELQKMSLADYSKLITARQRRALKRMSLGYKQLMGIIEEVKKNGGGKVIKTQLREAVILPSWVGVKFAVHDGKEFKEMTITPDMLGHRLGEFAFTTKRVVHSAPGIRATRGSKFLAVK